MRQIRTFVRVVRAASRSAPQTSTTLLAILMIVMASASHVHAQLGGLKKLGGKIKDGAVGAVDGVRGKNDDTSAAADSQDANAPVKPKDLKDGETAVNRADLSEAEATAKVKAYFNGKDIDFTVNADTGRINTDWYNERRCGPGFQRCANRASVKVNTEDGQTAVRIQVFERKREAGLNSKPWNENAKSKGKETAQLAAQLESYFASTTGAKQ